MYGGHTMTPACLPPHAQTMTLEILHITAAHLMPAAHHTPGVACTHADSPPDAHSCLHMHRRALKAHANLQLQPLPAPLQLRARHQAGQRCGQRQWAARAHRCVVRAEATRCAPVVVRPRMRSAPLSTQRPGTPARCRRWVTSVQGTQQELCWSRPHVAPHPAGPPPSRTRLGRAVVEGVQQPGALVQQRLAPAAAHAAHIHLELATERVAGGAGVAGAAQPLQTRWEGVGAALAWKSSSCRRDQPCMPPARADGASLHPLPTANLQRHTQSSPCAVSRAQQPPALPREQTLAGGGRRQHCRRQ